MPERFDPSEATHLPTSSDAAPAGSASAGPPADPPPPSRRIALGIMGGFAVLAGLGTLLGGDLLNPPATTADGDYEGETLEFLIPIAEGGGTDTWARFVGTELVKVVPGHPGFAPRNEAGGEGITGTNHFALSARPDGTEVLVSAATTVVPYLLKRHVVKYDYTTMQPILANGTGAVVYARLAAGVRGLRDLVDRSKPLRFGGITATGLDLTTLLAFDLLDMDVEAIFGFEGRGPVNLALQRGEIDIDYSTTSTYPSAVAGLVKDKTAVPLFSLGQVDERGNLVRDPNFEDLPTVVEAYTQIHGGRPDPQKLAAYRAVLGVTYTYQKDLWVSGETPAAAIELLRRSAEKLGADPNFVKSAKKVLGGYPLDAAGDLRARMQKAYTVDDALRERIVTFLKSTYNVTID